MAEISIQNISKFYGDQKVLDNVHLEVDKGQVVGLLGPNGAGKSTLIRVVTAYLWPTEGIVRVLGETLGHVNVHELRRRIGLVSPSGTYKVEGRLTARDVALTGFFGTLGLFDEPSRAQCKHADELLDELALRKLASQQYRLLSSGEQMRVLLARALASKPELLLLDEPTSGLDIRGRESVLATIERLARRADAPSVIIVTHRPEELPPVVGHALLLSAGGVIASGPTEDVFTDRTLSRAYGCPVRVARRHGRWSLSVHPRAWLAMLGNGGG